MATLNVIGQLFQHSLPFRRLFWSDALSQLGQNMLFVLLPALIEQATHDLRLTGLAFAGEIAAYGLLSPYSGWAADRYDQKKLMHAANLGRAATMLLMVLSLHLKLPVVSLIVLSILLGFFGTLYTPARAAFLRRILQGEFLLSACAVEGTVLFVMRLFSPALLGIILTVSDIYVGLALSATVYVFSSALLLPDWVNGPWQGENTPESLSRQVIAGWNTILGSISLRQFLAVDLTFCLIGMGAWSSSASWLQEIAHQPPAANGWLQAAMGVGGALGTRLGSGRRATTRNLLLMLTGIGLTYTILLVGHDLTTICSAWFCRGVLIGNFAVVLNQQLARKVKPEVIGRVQASWEQAINVALFLGSITSPWLLQRFGVLGTYQIYVAAILTLSAVSWLTFAAEHEVD